MFATLWVSLVCASCAVVVGGKLFGFLLCAMCYVLYASTFTASCLWMKSCCAGLSCWTVDWRDSRDDGPCKLCSLSLPVREDYTADYFLSTGQGPSQSCQS